MIKTNEHNVSFNDLTVDTAGLQALTHAGIKTAILLLNLRFKELFHYFKECC